MRPLLPLLCLVILPLRMLGAIGETPEQSVSRYGKPERDAMKESGLLYFRSGGLCVIAHFHQNRCDVLSIFRPEVSGGLHEELSEERIKELLLHDGGNADWQPLPGFTINRVWGSADGKTFAIYDTMRHKLVIMTREAYRREKEAKKEALRTIGMEQKATR